MANNAKPLKSSILAADRDSLAAVKTILSYAPANPAYATAALTTLQADTAASVERRREIKS